MSQNFSYDQMPYESNPFPQSSPAHLRTIGVLFGMNPPALENARVLELGCAAGGNLTGFSTIYPNSHSVGVDLSKVQIDEGKEFIQKAGIKNLELKHASITDIDESWGKFDYIISHGVFSWVPDFVKDKMLEICGKNLTDNGIAYISYNTLPGWSMPRGLREMMLYHTSSFTTDQDKVSQARLLLQFLKDSTEGSKTPYAEFLRTEADLLANQPDHYIRHEHLEDNNTQFYFNEFMSHAAKHGLQYLGDASLTSMYIGNLPDKVAEKLQEIKDIVRSEQYMDYITNRRFRSTLMCKNSVQLNRSLSYGDIKKFYISMKARPEKEIHSINISDPVENIKFFFDNSTDIFVSSSSPAMKAILYTLAENTHTMLSIDEVIKSAKAKLPNIPNEQFEAELINNALKLVMKGYITISSEAPKHITNISKKPKVSELIRAQSEHNSLNWVTNLRHEKIFVNIFDKMVFRYLDGKNTLDQVKEKILQHIEKGDLTMSKNNAPITSKEDIEKELDAIFNNIAPKLEKTALLIG